METGVLRFHRLVLEACKEAGMRERHEEKQPGWVRRVQRPPPVQRELRTIRRQRRNAVRHAQVVVAAQLRGRLRSLTHQQRRVRKAIGGRRLAKLLKEDPKEFYKHYRQKPAPLPSSITPASLVSHFQQLLGSDPPEIPVPELADGAAPSLEQME